MNDSHGSVYNIFKLYSSTVSLETSCNFFFLVQLNTVGRNYKESKQSFTSFH